MNYKLFLLGVTFLVVGLLMYYDVRKRKAASEETNWKGQLLPQYIQFWIWSIISIIGGLVFVVQSLAN
ncbi:hypothetical protein [Pedobacter gandavensis]|uniref:hypothetical protein n=1 Tax=Pedobacter gandavensis TaxID=2679963 RepID=UPI0029310C3A|nr:hypothetical protein [Pedobacter gandavensis]